MFFVPAANLQRREGYSTMKRLWSCAAWGFSVGMCQLPPHHGFRSYVRAAHCTDRTSPRVHAAEHRGHRSLRTGTHGHRHHSTGEDGGAYHRQVSYVSLTKFNMRAPPQTSPGRFCFLHPGTCGAAVPKMVFVSADRPGRCCLRVVRAPRARQGPGARVLVCA